MKLIFFYLFLFPQTNHFITLKNAETFSAKVIKIVDGDTFDVLTKDSIIIRIRMNGIDCPEKKQDYYQVCKDGVSELIFTKDVQLITHGKDRYKRTIADVFYKKKNINLNMIQAGYAWHYKKYSSNLEMAKAETKARIQKIGLWKMKDPIAPWDFRRLSKQKNVTKKLRA